MAATTRTADSSLTPPSDFICPLSKTVMADPVMSKYGTSFDRKSILKWCSEDGNTNCPVTGRPIRLGDFVPNANLQWKIQYWRKCNPSTGTEQNYGTNDNVPKRYICPLTNTIMKDPVMTKNGQSFDRTAIMAWIDAKGDICPITANPLKKSNLAPNPKLKFQIDQYLEVQELEQQFNKACLDLPTDRPRKELPANLTTTTSKTATKTTSIPSTIIVKSTNAPVNSKSSRQQDVSLTTIFGDCLPTNNGENLQAQIKNEGNNNGSKQLLSLLDNVLTEIA